MSETRTPVRSANLLLSWCQVTEREPWHVIVPERARESPHEACRSVEPVLQTSGGFLHDTPYHSLICHSLIGH